MYGSTENLRGKNDVNNNWNRETTSERQISENIHKHTDVIVIVEQILPWEIALTVATFLNPTKWLSRGLIPAQIEIKT